MENSVIADTMTVQAVLDARVAACRTKDLDRLMALYSEDATYYDVVPPLRFIGSGEVRRNFARWFEEYQGNIELETHEMTISDGGNIAFAHMLHLDSGTRNNGLDGAVWVRSTVCLQRSAGRWHITHEHISMPGTWPSPKQS